MAERLLGDPGAQAALAALHGRSLNFDPDDRGAFTRERGWHVDHYRQTLPREQPGDPVAGGSWETARGLMRRYEFADPSIVRAVYHPDVPLAGREMLLELRFWGLRFHAGVRVGGVIDETRTVDGRRVRVWGWNYRTLQGHLEMGQMDYEVWKWLDSGEVEFRIGRYARPASIRNPLVRLGFHLFGRREQVRFARRACERMARLTAAALDGRGEPVGLAGAAVAVRPAGAARVPPMADVKLLSIYLNDHLAVLVGGRRLAERVLGATRDDEIRALVAQVRPELAESEREVEGLLRRIGASPSRLKRAGAWLGERGGLLKLNGSLRGYSPLSRLLELEALGSIVDLDRALWRSLEQAAPELGDDFAGRAERAERRRDELERLRLTAAGVALGGSDRRL